MDLLKSLTARKQKTPFTPAIPQVAQPILPIEELEHIQQMHSREPVEDHLNILFKNTQINGLPFLDFYREAMRRTGTDVHPWKSFRRPQALLNLLQYFLYSLDLEGARAECGVLFGMSAWATCMVGRQADNQYTGKDYFLIDSFEGFKSAHEADYVKTRNDLGSIEEKALFKPGFAAVPIEHVGEVLKDFTDVQLLKGWIPEIFDKLSESTWSYVHIDVDLYEATRECIAYFYPRMTPGGVIICDDYGATLFPGAARAWREYCDQNNISYAILDTGQAVIIR